MAKLDLRQGETLEILVEDDIQYFINFSDFDELDTEYDIIINEGDDQISYSVGSGITLEQSTKSLIWQLDTAPLGVGIHVGYLKSRSVISGIYAFVKLEIIVSNENE